jgi:2-C-methyl-D-erythritol 4-phosphate cytidylyltransferase
VPDELLASATDDAWLVERLGGRVIVVAAGADNIKVTTVLDLDTAARLLAGRSSDAGENRA